MKYFTIILLAIVVSACHVDVTDDPKVIQAYMGTSGNGLTQTLETDELIYTASYIPDYMRALQEVDFTIADTTQFLSAVERTAGHHYILLTIASIQALKTLPRIISERQKDWTQVQNDLEYNLKGRITIIENDQPRPCVLYQSFRGLNPDQEIQFMLLFEHGDQWNGSGAVSMIFNDNLINNSIVEFDFDQADIDRIPQLELLTRK